MTGPLEGEIALVTGGASGIGAATARRLAAAGARLAVLDRDGQGAAAVAAGLAGAIALEADIADKGAVVAAFAEMRSRLGGLGILVNCAGVESVYTLEKLPEVEWSRVLAVNLTGAMLCTQAAIAPMAARGGGAVVNVASIAGKRISYSGGPAYTASKAGLLGFTRHAAFELAVHKIRVNAVCPGPTLTPMIERNLSAAQQAGVAKMVPLGRWVMPDDVADAILFLAGPGAAMCTGTTLDIDGGVLVSNGSPYDEYFARRR